MLALQRRKTPQLVLRALSLLSSVVGPSIQLPHPATTGCHRSHTTAPGEYVWLNALLSVHIAASYQEIDERASAKAGWQSAASKVPSLSAPIMLCSSDGRKVHPIANSENPVSR